MRRIRILWPAQDRLCTGARIPGEMNQAASPAPASRHSRLTFRSIVSYGIPTLLVLFVVCALLPTFDTSRQHANELVAAVKLRQINSLQAKYSVDHPTQGFSCVLPLVWSGELSGSRDYNLPVSESGTASGYKFALSSCEPNAEGMILHYQVTAIPVWPGATGYRAFCTDDSGRIWYDQGGSAAKCFVSRRPLP